MVASCGGKTDFPRMKFVLFILRKGGAYLNRNWKRLFSLLLAAVLLVSASAAVWAEGDSRVVLGADLTEEQIATVYRLFGIERGSVEELTVTNAEERSYLKGFVDDKVIGKYAISMSNCLKRGRAFRSRRITSPGALPRCTKTRSPPRA